MDAKDKVGAGFTNLNECRDMSTGHCKCLYAGNQGRFLGIYEIIIIGLIVLSIIGIGITDFSPVDSYKYWVAMVPIFCGACLILEWSRVRGKGFKWTTILQTQLLHWAGLLVAVRLVFEMLHKGRLDNENTGLVILLLLALSFFMAGIHLGWRLCLVGGGSGRGTVSGNLPGRVCLDIAHHRACGYGHCFLVETLCRQSGWVMKSSGTVIQVALSEGNYGSQHERYEALG